MFFNTLSIILLLLWLNFLLFFLRLSWLLVLFTSHFKNIIIVRILSNVEIDEITVKILYIINNTNIRIHWFCFYANDFLIRLILLCVTLIIDFKLKWVYGHSLLSSVVLSSIFLLMFRRRIERWKNKSQRLIWKRKIHI